MCASRREELSGGARSCSITPYIGTSVWCYPCESLWKTNGFLFHSQTEQKKTLAGLKPTQANEILQKSKALSLDVVTDPAMAMMMDVERRGAFGE